MTSDNENDSTNLKARLKAKLKKARVINSESSDEEDDSKKNKSGLKSINSAIAGIRAPNEQSGSCFKLKTKLVRNEIDKPLESSDEEEEPITSKCRKPVSCNYAFPKDFLH